MNPPLGRILIIAPNWLGDSIMAQPLLARLSSKAPAAPIDVIAVPAVAPVFRRMPEVARVIELLRRVNQRLRRNAADVETGAAELLAFDERG